MTTLLIIDPQRDFHEAEEGRSSHDEGTLAVPGAIDDSRRISEMINNNIDKIDNIYVTLDSHHVRNIYYHRLMCFAKSFSIGSVA